MSLGNFSSKVAAAGSVGSSSATPARSHAPEAPRLEAAGGEGSVLLVEDDEDVRLMARLMLERLGFSVLAALSPHDALEKCRSSISPIDCLLTDVVMPEMNGVELSVAVRRIIPNLGVIYMSGYSFDLVAQRDQLERGVIFLQKPFEVKTLREKVRQAILFSRGADEGKKLPFPQG